MLVKVPEGISKICRCNKYYSDMLFFYQLKALREDGFICKKNISKILTNHTGLTESTVFRKLKRLVNLKWVLPEKSGYTLISYNKFYKLIGYDLTYNVKKKRLGSFRISKVKLDHEFKEKIALNDIFSNIIKQQHIVSKSLSDKEYNSVQKAYSVSISGDNGLEDHIYQLNTETPTLDDLSNFMKVINKKGKVINTDISLSCDTMAKLLGYKSGNDALKLQYKLVKMGLINLVRRKVRWKYDASLQQLNNIRSLRTKWNRCVTIRREEGFSYYKLLSNQIIIL